MSYYLWPLNFSLRIPHQALTSTPRRASISRHRVSILHFAPHSSPPNPLSSRRSFPLSASHEVSLPSQPGVPVQLVAASQSLSKPKLKSARVSGEGFRQSVGSKMVVLVVVGYVSPRRRCGQIRWRRRWR
ncbi:hypothetical protein Droror1_Dr00004380 [Drosera rotundifolia]